MPSVPTSCERSKTSGIEEDILTKVNITADGGFHSEVNMKTVNINGIDAYIPYNQFRKRDVRFKETKARQVAILNKESGAQGINYTTLMQRRFDTPEARSQYDFVAYEYLFDKHTSK